MEEWGYELPESWASRPVPATARVYLHFARWFRRLYWTNFRYFDYVRRPVRTS
jgi:hypothetical protein